MINVRLGIIAFLCVFGGNILASGVDSKVFEERGDTVYRGDNWYLKPRASFMESSDPKALVFVPIDTISDTNFVWNEERRATFLEGRAKHPKIAVIGSYVNLVYYKQVIVTEVYQVLSQDYGITFSDSFTVSEWGNAPALSPAIASSDSIVYIAWHDANGGYPYGGLLRKSYNKGQTWEPTDTIAFYYWGDWLVNRVDIIAIDSFLFVTYECWDSLGWNQRFKKSTDKGETWFGERIVGGLAAGRGAEIAYGDGVIHVIRGGPNSEIRYDRSTDLGETWSNDTLISEDDMIASQWPSVAADPYGNVYACWFDYKYGGAGWIFYRKSSDHGTTWGEIKSLSTSPKAHTPSIFADSFGVYVVYEDRSRDFNNIDILFRKSRDFGESWTPEVMLDSTANSCFDPRIITEGNKYHVVYNGLWELTFEAAWYKMGGFYIPGDPDDNGIIEVSDAVYLINYIFSAGNPPVLYSAGDADCNEIVEISDAVYLINYIFNSGPAPCE